MLRISMEFRRGILFVRLKGRLNKYTIKKFNNDVSVKVKLSGIRKVVFNVEDLKDIDLKGINSLLYVYELCMVNDGQILICGVKENLVKEKLKKNRLLKYLMVIDNELRAFEIINV